MKNIALIPNQKKDENLTCTNKIISKLKRLGCELYIDRRFLEFVSEKINFCGEFPENIELIIVIGGDGSVLDAAAYALKYSVPLLGVNLGRVGYLSELEISKLDDLERIVNGDYDIIEKMLLKTEKISETERISSKREALNDVVISHTEFLGIADFTVKGAVGGLKYRADGVIICTPAGSTAYSLSAGGPIVSNNLDCITVTPVCPHSFFDRSIVFSQDEKIEIENTGLVPLNISVDGRFFSTLHPKEVCEISKSPQRVKFLTFNNGNMFTNMFSKMKITEDLK